MKIRNGFVSNSSSSSFVIRGIKMKEKELAKICGIDENADDLFDELYNYFGYGKGVQIQSTRDFFDGNSTGEVIIGVDLANLDDGVVKALPEPDDVKIKDKIEKKLGTKINSALRTYIQFVSNDNY